MLLVQSAILLSDLVLYLQCLQTTAKWFAFLAQSQNLVPVCLLQRNNRDWAQAKGVTSRESRISNVYVRKAADRKFPEFLRIFVPDFLPNIPANFPRIFRGFFVLRFVGDGDPKKNHQKSPLFSMQNSQASAEKIFTQFFWR